MRCGILPVAVFAASAVGQAEIGIVSGADWNSAVARGSIFSVFNAYGAIARDAARALPLPTTLQGLRVLVKDSKGAMMAAAPLLYVSSGQVNAVMPSVVPAGTWTVGVELNGTEIAHGSVAVVEKRFAAFTQGSRGFGPAVLQNVDSQGAVSLNRFLNPARPGQVVTLWGTGLGALPSGSDAEAPSAVDLSAGVTVRVGPFAVKPLYAGRAPGMPGADQINFRIPENLAPRCHVPVTVETSSGPGSEVTIAVASVADFCPSELGLSREALARLESGGTVIGAVLDLKAITGAGSQSLRAGLSYYDVAHVSTLWSALNRVPVLDDRCTTPPDNSGTDLFSISTPDLYGFFFPWSAGAINLEIRGSDGCAWSVGRPQYASFVSASSSTCRAATFSLSGTDPAGRSLAVAGAFPTPRPASTIASFKASTSQATWSVNGAAAGDVVQLRAYAWYRTFFGYYRCINACKVSPSAGSVPLTMSRCSSEPVSATMVLSNATYQAIGTASTGQAAPDFVLVRTENGVQTDQN